MILQADIKEAVDSARALAYVIFKDYGQIEDCLMEGNIRLLYGWLEHTLEMFEEMEQREKEETKS